jgi:hypothetical protein
MRPIHFGSYDGLAHRVTLLSFIELSSLVRTRIALGDLVCSMLAWERPLLSGTETITGSR